jgi:hypothetical protein
MSQPGQRGMAVCQNRRLHGARLSDKQECLGWGWVVDKITTPFKITLCEINIFSGMEVAIRRETYFCADGEAVFSPTVLQESEQGLE